MVVVQVCEIRLVGGVLAALADAPVVPAFTTKLPRQTVCDHPEESAPTMPALVNGAVHFKVIQAVHFILIYPVHLIVIWAVHLKCCNHQLISHYSTQCVVTLTHVSRPVV